MTGVGGTELSQVVTCNGAKPEFKDAVEASTQNRVGSGYVSLKNSKDYRLLRAG